MALVALGVAALTSAGCMGTRSMTASRYDGPTARTVVADRSTATWTSSHATPALPPAPPIVSYSRSDTRTAQYVPPPPPPPAWPGTAVTPVSRAPSVVPYARPAPRPVAPRAVPAPAPVRREAPVRRSAPRVQKSSGLFGCLDGT